MSVLSEPPRVVYASCSGPGGKHKGTPNILGLDRSLARRGSNREQPAKPLPSRLRFIVCAAVGSSVNARLQQEHCTGEIEIAPEIVLRQHMSYVQHEVQKVVGQLSFDRRVVAKSLDQLGYAICKTVALLLGPSRQKRSELRPQSPKQSQRVRVKSPIVRRLSISLAKPSGRVCQHHLSPRKQFGAIVTNGEQLRPFGRVQQLPYRGDVRQGYLMQPQRGGAVAPKLATVSRRLPGVLCVPRFKPGQQEFCRIRHSRRVGDDLPARPGIGTPGRRRAQAAIKPGRACHADVLLELANPQTNKEV
ncbi:Uncharacterised protein [Mycobacteroides abscessus subsp. bolletii]|nr:Uncharacterised protein [Mycobacteroides abscessus subsp. bolletii]SKP87825.1 Uncharacterised protein [Mycobacteroides abscessus subsp. bolletii]SKQ37589.1 Uncharacterised protein [Mycobacteroides abscessus subsp. bolletii]SKQ52680.1 Uncharacterised protein [Mycobacteroides abscessus subsp. bolletii]